MYRAKVVCFLVFISALSSANAGNLSSVETALDSYVSSFLQMKDLFNKTVDPLPSCSSESTIKEKNLSLHTEGTNLTTRFYSWSGHMLWRHPYWYATVGDDCSEAPMRFKVLEKAINNVGISYLNFFLASCPNDQDSGKVQIDPKTVLLFKTKHELLEAQLHMLKANLIICEELEPK